MLDYTDITSKIEDAQSALDGLYDLVYSQYDGLFVGEDQVRYGRMVECLKAAGRCLSEADELNGRLSDAFEEHFGLKDKEK